MTASAATPPSPARPRPRRPGELYPRYGFPNDLLAKLAEVGARVVDRPVTPIYGDERSGIRILRVIGPIAWLLLRSGLRRVARQRQIRARLAAVRPTSG
ncbi:MAG: hypothetical protein R3F43_03925 [bacterium]